MALEVALFKRGFRPQLYQAQNVGPYYKSLHEAVERARRNASHAESVQSTTVSAMQWSTVTRGRPRSARNEGARQRSRSRSTHRRPQLQSWSQPQSQSRSQPQLQSQSQSQSRLEYTPPLVISLTRVR